MKQKKQGWFYGREYTYFFGGTAFLLQGVIYSDGAKLRRYKLK